MSGKFANDKNDSEILSNTAEIDDSSSEKLIEEELNSLSLVNWSLPSVDEQLSPTIRQSCCDEENSSIFDKNLHPDPESTVLLPFGLCDNDCGNPFEESFFDSQWNIEEENCQNLAECSRVESSETPQPESTMNDLSASDLLVSVLQSHIEALNDQKIVLARQTDALNRLAAAIEGQTAMMDMLHENHRFRS